MRSPHSIFVLVIPALLLTAAAIAGEFEITSFSGNGEITWEDTNTNGHYTIQWCPNLATNWSSEWSSFTQIPATGGTTRANIPMFFRVLHRPLSSPSANMMLVSGGGQFGGPQYDFYMGKYEVTEQEFVTFLNDAQANTNNSRGAYMWFDDNGDIYIRVKYSGYMMFDISNSDLIYAKTNPEGSRYSCFVDSVNNPITGVSWYGAIKYCNWLTVILGRGENQRCYSEGADASDWHPANITNAAWTDGFDNSERMDWVNNYTGFRLPMTGYASAASYFGEFYKAGAWNGSSNTVYAFGRNTLSGQYANYSGSGDPYEIFTIKTTPVGFYDGGVHFGFQTASNANYFGIYDLSGNVSEWCTDSAASDDLMHRIFWGGCWNSSSTYVKTAINPSDMNYKNFPETCSIYVGFRVVSTSP
jgi:formylglycine-generating enzyme required for sulfatase activity